MNLTTPLLTTQLKKGGQSKFSNNNSNLTVNAILIDCSFTVPADYTSKWDFLKNIFLNVTLRKGSGTGGNIALLSNVSVNAAIHYSDVKAGVSIVSTQFTQGQKARISGCIPIGYFSMGSNDALETYINVSGDLPEGVTLDFNVSSVYMNNTENKLLTYQQTKPTGSDQPYKNVLECWYIGKESDKTVTLQDQMGSQSLPIDSAIALTNAVGELEFFTDIGQLYVDPFGISQNMHFNIPVDDATSGAEVLVVGYDFNPDLLLANGAESLSQREMLITAIRTSQPEKYQYLQYRGLV